MQFCKYSKSYFGGLSGAIQFFHIIMRKQELNKYVIIGVSLKSGFFLG